MSETLGVRTSNSRAEALTPVNRAEPKTPTSEVAPTAPVTGQTVAEAARASRKSPLETAIGGFLTADRRLNDMLGAPQFPLALKEAALMLEDLAAASETAADPWTAGDWTSGDSNDEKALYREAALVIREHLDARAAYRTDAARLVKT